LCRRWRPENAVLDASVEARRAGQSVWKPWWRRAKFWLLAVATAIVGVAPGLVLTGSAPDFWREVFLRLQFQVHPAMYLTTPPPYSASVAFWATVLDCALIPIYVSLFALWIVHARHRLNYSPQNKFAARLDRWTSSWPLIVLAAADLSENAGVFVGLHSRGAARQSAIEWVTASGDVKFLALASIVLYLLVACLLPARRATS
jgi:hypothetical protein